MRCFYCNKHEAVKSYEHMERGEVKREYYCLSCYEKLFLCIKDTSDALSFSACPYCETTLQEVESSGLVGCPYCYKTMQRDILPTIVKMQGHDCGHRGKMPLISERDEFLLGKEAFLTQEARDEFRAELVKKERLHRQIGEMQTLIEYLKIHDPLREKEYREKLERMQRMGAVEEEIIW